MSMRFSQAGRAQTPDYAQAQALAAQLRGQELQRDQQERTSNLMGGAMLAEASPEGTFTNAWDVMQGTQGVTGGGEVASVLGNEAAAAAAEKLAYEKALEVGGIEAATLAGAEAGTAATIGGAGTAGAGTGLMAGLGSMGPVGWASLAALGLGSGLFG